MHSRTLLDHFFKLAQHWNNLRNAHPVWKCTLERSWTTFSNSHNIETKPPEVMFSNSARYETCFRHAISDSDRLSHFRNFQKKIQMSGLAGSTNRIGWSIGWNSPIANFAAFFSGTDPELKSLTLRQLILPLLAGNKLLVLNFMRMLNASSCWDHNAI